ncbi:MAG: 4Fe-4S binding protein [Tannerella sp.]|jgi:ferredoxin|nr:4Fe-4S binding protein [Tannerella sp.]
MKKKSVNTLKTVRVVLATLVFVPILLFFVDFRDALPNQLHGLLEIQLIPAIFSGATVILIALFLLTLVFGRVYCSVICPAGTLQDVFERIGRLKIGRFGRTKKNGKFRFRHTKAHNILRYGLLALTTVLAIFGSGELALLLDPYSNFGRIATNIFRPLVGWMNNLLAGALTSAGVYSLYNVTINIATGALIAGIIIFAVFSVMVWFKGRLFCNTLCPVGSLLSLVSRYSFFRVMFDENVCNQCGTCSKICKSECIDSKNMTVDMSRCVACFNCDSSCTKSAIKYQFAFTAARKNKNKKQEIINPKPATGVDRRSFIAASATLMSSVPLIALAQATKKTEKKAAPITPPGSLNINRFKDLCTACHLCVVQCPSHVLLPAGLEYGLGYALKPYMSYIDSYCNYTCTICADVCPTDAIKPITAEEKIEIQTGIANFYKDKCIVATENTDCGACSEHCPTQAVHMIPYIDTLTIPKVEPELCIGCGGCESICPARPARAIVVIAHAEHQIAQLPKVEEVEEVEVDDFGF